MGIARKNDARETRAYWMRCIRIDRGLTQAQLARRVGVSANQVSRYERGHDDPSLDVLNRLLGALECWYSDLRADPIIQPPPRRSIQSVFLDKAC